MIENKRRISDILEKLFIVVAVLFILFFLVFRIIPSCIQSYRTNSYQKFQNNLTQYTENKEWVKYANLMTDIDMSKYIYEDDVEENGEYILFRLKEDVVEKLKDKLNTKGNQKKLIRGSDECFLDGKTATNCWTVSKDFRISNLDAVSYIINVFLYDIDNNKYIALSKIPDKSEYKSVAY